MDAVSLHLVWMVGLSVFSPPFSVPLQGRSTVVQNSQESRRKYWVTRSHHLLIHLLRTARFTRVLHCTHSFARSLIHSRARGEVNDSRCLKTTWFSPQRFVFRGGMFVEEVAMEINVAQVDHHAELDFSHYIHVSETKRVVLHLLDCLHRSSG